MVTRGHRITGNEDVRVDADGGATFVLWPFRGLTLAQRRQVIALAQSNGWNVVGAQYAGDEGGGRGLRAGRPRG